MTIDEMRHEVLDLLQSVYVLAARLKVMLPEEAEQEREVLDHLVRRAQLCRERVTGAAPAVPEVAPVEAPVALPRLRAVVVEDDPATRDFIVETLSRQCGHEVVATAGTGPAMVREVLAHEPDLVVFDIHLPGVDGLTALEQIAQERAVAAVAVTGDRNSQLLSRALEDNILAYLLKPVDARQLMFAVQLAWARFTEFDQLRSENQTLQQNLHDRKVIERAKGVLMRRHHWTEQQAFRTLQKRAMDLRLSVVKLAQDILDGKGLPPGPP